MPSSSEQSIFSPSQFDNLVSAFEEAREADTRANVPAEDDKLWRAAFGSTKDANDDKGTRHVRREFLPKKKNSPPLGPDARKREKDEYRHGMKNFLHSLQSISLNDPPEMPPMISGYLEEPSLARRSRGQNGSIDKISGTKGTIHSEGAAYDVFGHGNWDQLEDDSEEARLAPLFQNELDNPDDEPELTQLSSSDPELEVLQGTWQRKDYSRQRRPSLASGFLVAEVRNRTVFGLKQERAGIFRLRKSRKLWLRGYWLNLDRSPNPEISVVWERSNAHGKKKSDRFCWHRLSDEMYDNLVNVEKTMLEKKLEMIEEKVVKKIRHSKQHNSTESDLPR